MKRKILLFCAVMVTILSCALLPSVASYAESSVNRAQNGLDSVNTGSATDLTGMINVILNTVFGVVGIVAVIMIIMGGVNYMLSQGDPGKIKKAKDTILYGIIGLVITLLAFAIVSFVLNALQ